jgi:alpha-beta hydrolase superfamily lysophospholipase
MLLIHGIAEHSGRYDQIARRLARGGVDVASFDNRGHGRTGGVRGHIDHFGQFLDDVAEHLVARRSTGLPVILFGHSLGGLIAATSVVEAAGGAGGARPQPDLLVLSSPALGAVVPVWQRVAAPVLSRVAPRFRVSADMDPTHLSRDPEVQRAYEQDPLRLRKMSSRFGQEVFTTMVSTSAALDRITIPTYVFHGAEDELVPAEVSRPLAALPTITYRLWPGLRHETLNEPEGDQVIGELLAWLEQQLIMLGGSSPDPGSGPEPVVP